MRDDPHWNAILYGPIVLAGLLGKDGMPPEAPYAAGNQLQFRSVSDPSVPTLGKANEVVDKWLEKTGAMEFSTRVGGGSSPIRFVPLANVTNERYSVYWKLGTA
jgi:hypothetical protein